jgi:hypothetical protein
MDKISLTEKFALFDERWRPKVVARLNGQEIKLVKVKGGLSILGLASASSYPEAWSIAPAPMPRRTYCALSPSAS